MVTNLKTIAFFIMFQFVVHAQTNNSKNIIIINKDRLGMSFSNIEIDGIKIRHGFKRCIVSNSINDSIEIKVPSSVLFFFTLKSKKIIFPIKNKDNYFLYKSASHFNKMSLKQIDGDDLVELKKKNYVRKVMNKFNLE